MVYTMQGAPKKPAILQTDSSNWIIEFDYIAATLLSNRIVSY